MKGVLGSACPAKPGSGTRSAFALNAGSRLAQQGRSCSLSSLYRARHASSASAGRQQHRQPLLPPLRAASQLSQAELEELLAENAKLKQLLSTYKDRLAPEQVARLTKQYEEIAALAAAAGLQLEDPLNNSTPAAAAGAKQGAPAAPAAAGAKEEAAAASKGPQPKAVEIAEGDRKVKAWVLDKGDVVQFSFDGASSSKRGAANSKTSATSSASASSSQTQTAPQPPAAAAAPPRVQPPAAAAAAPMQAKAPAAPPAAAAPAAAATNKAPAPAARAAVDPVAAFIQATKAKSSGQPAAAAPAPARAPAAPPAAPAAAATPPAASKNGAAANGAAPPAAKPPAAAAAAANGAAAASSSSSSDSSSGGRFSKWSKMADEAEAKQKAANQAAKAQPAAAAAPAAAKAPAAAAAPAAAQPPPAAAAAPAAPPKPQPAPAAPAAAAPAQAKAPAAAAPAAAAPVAAVPPAAAAAAAPAAPAPPKSGMMMPPPPPAARLKPNLHMAQPKAAKPQDFTAPAPTSPLFSGSSSSSSRNGAPSSSSSSTSIAKPAGPTTTAIVDVGPPKPPKPVVEDILDIPDPIEQAVKVVSKITPEERKRREAVRQKEREFAVELLKKHDPVKDAATKHSWLMFTVPERPVAGCEVVVYYNRTQSEVLRERNRIQLILGYNQWELQSEQGKVDLYPSSIPHIDGSDFWCTRFKIPENAYEVNFVLTDGEQLYDNNGGQDFVYKTTAGITWEEWQAAALERQEEQEKERHAAEEARRAEEAKREAEDKEKRDKENAMRRVAELRDGYAGLVEGAMTRRKVDPTEPTSPTYWYVTPRPPQAGAKCTLLYNSKAGPLAWIEDKRKNKDKTTPVEGQQVPKVLLGFNNWKIKLEPIAMKHSSIPGEDTEVWWETTFNIPNGAVAVNFVVNCENAWDNNGGKDHKIAVDLPKPHTPATVSEWAEEMLPDFLKQEREMRLAAEKIAAEKEAKRLAARNIAKGKAKAVLRRQMKHVMFTEPEIIQAGERVTLYYNPDDTVLAGSDQIYFTGGFNRWNHKRALGPVKMRPPGPNGRHWQVRFSVPKEAVQLDFVFSNVMSGEGLYDNRGGFDYHLPIEKGTGSISQRLHVCHIAVEMAPVAKVGGLGDVVTALARAVQEEGHLVEVILPRYDFFLQSPVLAGQMRYECEFDWGGTRVFVSTAIVEGLRCFFIEPRNNFFATPTVYGRYDDEVRFDFFCKAALEFLLKTGRQPDILHCHDWSTAHVAKAFWEDYQPYGLYKPKVVFTIHNMNYGQKKIAEAAEWCQKFTTVSPTYAFEVGGHPAIAGQTAKFMGIRNGIDTELWSPTDNQYLPLPYDVNNIEEGKKRAREEIRKRCNISQWQDKMIIAVVSRLTPQKGVHLIKHAAYKALERGCQFVLLGSAPDPKVQAEFDELANELGHGHQRDAGFVFEYNEPLSHLIYAAADILLVPSMFEPCGLTQMIAMRYGGVPVVRHTGGLRDTVFDVDNDKPRAAWEVAGSSDWMRDKVDETNGFAFEGMDEGGLDYALNRAIDAFYNDKTWFRALQARVMRQDWSWNRPALDYVELYYSCTKQ